MFILSEDSGDLPRPTEGLCTLRKRGLCRGEPAVAWVLGIQHPGNWNFTSPSDSWSPVEDLTIRNHQDTHLLCDVWEMILPLLFPFDLRSLSFEALFSSPIPLSFLILRADSKTFLYFLWKNPGRSVYGCSKAAHSCAQFSWES